MPLAEMNLRQSAIVITSLGEDGSGCVVFLWFVVRVLSVVVWFNFHFNCTVNPRYNDSRIVLTGVAIKMNLLL